MNSKKGPFTAEVISNRKIGKCFYIINLQFSDEGAAVFAKTVAGQFCQINLSGFALPPIDQIPEYLRDACKRSILLRRPFGFSDINTENNKTTVEILYHTLGPSSLRMTTLKKGDCLDVIGPLGNGFLIKPDRKLVILIIGGTGAGPVIYLAKQIKTQINNAELIVFAGAKTADDMPYENLPTKIGIQADKWIPVFVKHGADSIVVATDDGSAGNKGFVTEYVSNWLGKTATAADKTIIYACGPEAMLAATAKIAHQYNIDCQVSMERMMGCGTGLCQSCAIECTENDSKIYKMCCKDGPVFNSRNVIFDTGH